MSKVKFQEGDKVRVKRGIWKGETGVVMFIYNDYLFAKRKVYCVKLDCNKLRFDFMSYYLDPLNDTQETNEPKVEFNTPISFSKYKVNENGELTTGDGHYVSEISLNFGIGRLAIGTRVKQWDKNTETPYIIMQATKEPKKIGKSLEPAEVNDEYPSIILNFVNEEGLDVLIEMAQDIKKYYKERANK